MEVQTFNHNRIEVTRKFPLIVVKEAPELLEISDAMYYYWKSKYGSMEDSDPGRMKELEAES